MTELKYKRILLKVSGEALGEKTAQGDGFGLDFSKMIEVAASIKSCVDMGVQVGLVIGGGNFWRGVKNGSGKMQRSHAASIKACVDMGVQVGLVIGGGNFWRGVKNGSGKMQRSHADSIGMLATVMNAIAVADVLEQHGLDARVLTAVEMNKFAEYFTRDLANRYLNEGKVVLFAAGTGNPYFSTDTGAVLRGVEIEADAILMAKNVDAIYSADPKRDPNAIRYSELTYAKVLEDGLKATAVTAMALAMDNNMPMVCFGLGEENSIIRVVRGEKIGTTVTN